MRPGALSASALLILLAGDAPALGDVIAPLPVPQRVAAARLLADEGRRDDARVDAARVGSGHPPGPRRRRLDEPSVRPPAAAARVPAAWPDRGGRLQATGRPPQIARRGAEVAQGERREV